MRRAICAYRLAVISSEDILSLELIVERFEIVPRHCGNRVVRKSNGRLQSLFILPSPWTEVEVYEMIYESRR
jgi:hypothetical protein